MPLQIADDRWFRESTTSPEDLLAHMDAEALRRHLRALQVLTDAMLAHLGLPELLRELLNRLREVLSVDSATVLLCTEGGRSLVVRASRGVEPPAGQTVEIPLGRGIAGTVAVRRRAVIVDDVAQAQIINPMLHRLSSMMVAPLQVEGEILGVLHVGSFRSRTFRDLDLLQLQVVSDRVALAIKNALLYDRAQEEIRARTAAEQELRERQDLHQLLAETAADAIVTTDERSEIVSANPAAAEVFGYPVEELIGMEMTQLMPERFRQAHAAGMRRYLETGRRNIPWRGLELPGLHRSGREVLLEVAFAERERDGRRYFTGTMRDITERKATERLLATQHAVTRVLAHEQRVSEALPRVLQAIGQTLGWDLGVFWAWDGRSGVLRLTNQWSAAGVDDDAVEALVGGEEFAPGVGLPGQVKAQGRPVWIADMARDGELARGSAAVGAGIHGAFAFPVCVGGDCVGVVEFLSEDVLESDPALLSAMEALGSDIGQFMRRREAEERLQEREEVQAFLARSSIALAASALDYDGTLLRLAQQAVPALADWCAVYLPREGGEVERLVVQHTDPAREPQARELMRSGHHASAAGSVRRVMASGRSELISEASPEALVHDGLMPEHARLVGELGLASVMVVPLTARGRILGVIALVSSDPRRRFDRDDLEVAEEFARRAALSVDNARLFRDAQEASRAKSEFMAVMSHELRTPLNAVIGYADLLKLGIGTRPDSAAEYAERIGVSARHLTGLIEEILTFSRLEAGRDPVSATPVRVEEIVREIEVIAEPLAREKGVDFQARSPEEPMRMVSDPGKIRQILLNLVNNAVKFTDEGSVELTVEADGDRVAFRVADSGIGIPAELQERIFEPFWQVEQGTTRRVGGTGLGLSVTRQLVRLLHGELELRSEPGHGTTVTVRLPLRHEPESAPATPAA